MIRMSRVPILAERVHRTKATFPRWSALCTLAGASCLYLEPTWEPTVNLPPEILFPEDTSVSEPAFLEMLRDPMQAQVIADDPDGDVLSFQWVVQGSPNLVPNTLNDGTFWISTLEIPLDAVRDGDDITVVVGDTDNNNETVHFEVVFP